MQKNIVERTGKDVSPSHCRRSGIATFRRYPEQAENHTKRKLYRTGFLKQSLPIIPAKPDEYEVFTEYLTEENFNYLWKCAVNYATLLGKTIELPEGAIHEKTCMLYHRFAAILPDTCAEQSRSKQQLNIEAINGELRWVIYKHHDWNDSFYWLSVKFITLLSGQIREIAMSFMSLFIRKNGLNKFKDCYEFDFLFEWAIESLNCSDYEDSDKETIEKLLESYVNGEISLFLDNLHDHTPIDVVKALEEYNPANPLETRLIECFRSGIRFISGDDSIMNYWYDAHSESVSDYCEEYPPVTLDRIIRYIYDLNDFVCNQLEYTVNQEIQEAYPQEPTSFLILQPESKLFITGDYPEKFAKWFLEMVKIAKEITDYE